MALDPLLSDIQARILGCLIEKKLTTPDQYPLTMNAVRSACNQKSARNPVVNYYEGEIGHALRELVDLRLVGQPWSARAERFEHYFEEIYDVRRMDVAVLCVLMLRGPQTAGEIRTHSQRLHAFEDTDDVLYIVNRLIERDPPMVMRLPRQAGQKEERFVHLMAGEPDLDKIVAAAPKPRSSPLEQRVEALEVELADLREKLVEVQSKLD